MTLKDIKIKVLSKIEELNPNSEYLTDDEDISQKLNTAVNSVMYELCRIKKIPKYIEMNVTAGDVIDFETLASECGYDIYQIKLVTGVDYEPRADGTILKMLGDGKAEIDVFVYPEEITTKTKDSYEFELSADVLEIMPYGVAADLLSTDVSSNYKEFKEKYETMLMRLETRNHLPTISIVGGINV